MKLKLIEQSLHLLALLLTFSRVFYESFKINSFFNSSYTLITKLFFIGA